MSRKYGTGQGVRCSIFVSKETRVLMTRYKKHIHFSKLFEERVRAEIARLQEIEYQNQIMAIY